MPQLARQAAHLLRRVQGKQHATDDDHEEGASRPRKVRKLGVDEDLSRDPDSSSDSEADAALDQSPVVLQERVQIAEVGDAKTKVPTSKATKRPARTKSARATTLKIGHDDELTSNGSGPVIDLDENKMASWSAETTGRKPKKSFSKTSTAPVITTGSKFRTPLGLPSKVDTFNAKSRFKLPGSQPEADSQPGSSPPSSFKMPTAMPTIDQMGTAVQPLRRSKRKAGDDDAASANGSRFKHSSSLVDLGISSINSSFMDRQLMGAVHSDPLSRSSQADAEQADFSDAEELHDEDLEAAKGRTCPYCHNAVMNPKLADRLYGKEMSVREQAAFCQSHRRDEARQRWQEQQYPEIQWDILPTRIRRLSPHLTEIINDQRPSIFRERLAAKIASGNYRSLLQTLNNDAKAIDSLTPGYYGGRGAKTISSLLIVEFSKQIRGRAGQDRLIGASGVSGFVQAVLAPEAATMLIMEDMGVSVEEAVDILEESAEVGDLLFEGEDEDGGMSFSQI